MTVDQLPLASLATEYQGDPQRPVLLLKQDGFPVVQVSPQS
jgi:hypothetical protein